MSATAALHLADSAARVQAPAEAWARFRAASPGPDFHGAWLAVLCGQVEGVKAALLLLAEGDGHRAAAVWPDGAVDLDRLLAVAERACSEGQEVLTREAASAGHDAGVRLGCPIGAGGSLLGAVVLEMAAVTIADVRQALQHVHWSLAWLADAHHVEALARERGRRARLALATDLVATAIEEQRYASAVLAVANELAQRLACDRVSIGFEHRGQMRVEAISHTASFDRKANLVRLVAEAMDEAYDLGVVIAVPAGEGDELATLAHRQLASELRDIAVLSVPLVVAGQATGVITFERASGGPIDAATRELGRTIGLVLGPTLALKRASERNLARHGIDAARSGLVALFGPHHPGLKLISALVAALVLSLVFATGEYRVAARTVVEGQVQRAAVAPFDGYIAANLVRAGDTVHKGDVLLRLDDQDLRLEQRRLAGEEEQLARKQRQALAAQDRAAVAVLGAQAEQAAAQLALTEEKLARATLRAPFDGVVVSGDYSQLLGAPVEQGRVLFEVAPLDAYRVILQVDERDIAAVRSGQRGEIALAAMPHERLPFVVRQLTPISTAQDGRNYFRVEAQIEPSTARLRPGMEGVGKVAAGSRSLWWIWTHPLTDWARLAWWKWLP